MKRTLSSLGPLWFDLSAALMIVTAFAVLGYFSREFALDLHTQFFL